MTLFRLSSGTLQIKQRQVLDKEEFLYKRLVRVRGRIRRRLLSYIIPSPLLDNANIAGLLPTATIRSSVLNP